MCVVELKYWILLDVILKWIEEGISFVIMEFVGLLKFFFLFLGYWCLIFCDGELFEVDIGESLFCDIFFLKVWLGKGCEEDFGVLLFVDWIFVCFFLSCCLSILMCFVRVVLIVLMEVWLKMLLKY